MPATARAVFGDDPQVIEGGDDSVAADVAEAERADTRGVDHPGVRRVWEPKRDRRGGDVPAPPGRRADLTYGPIGTRDQGVDQRRLADARVADEDAAVPAEPLAERIQIGAGEGHLHRNAERLDIAR